jgi:hypothetical protein
MLLSMPVVDDVISSPSVLRSVGLASRLSLDKEWLAKRGTRRPALEDVWMGYAVSLLSSEKPVRKVSMDPPLGGNLGAFYFDDWGWKQTNTTMLMHNRNHNWQESRLALAHMHGTLHHCPSNASVDCDGGGLMCIMTPHVSAACRVRVDLKLVNYSRLRASFAERSVA